MHHDENPAVEPDPPALAARTFSLRSRPRALLVAAASLTVPSILATATPAHAGTGRRTLTVAPGEKRVLTESTELSQLVIGDGGTIAAPDGFSLTLTVNGIEVGSVLGNLYDNAGAFCTIAAGTYRGLVVITVAEANTIAYQGRSWPLRQALYVDAAGVDRDRSVLAAVVGGRIGADAAECIAVTSRSEAFNGVYVAGGSYRLTRPTIRMTGNGRNDFIGYGASIVGTGPDTVLVVDGATIANAGVVRDGVIADGGATVVVKNSTISVKDGTVHPEYENTGDQAFMMTCPWLLGMYGTVRATNTLGSNTKATYLNTSVTNENWALWSIDSGLYGGGNIRLVVINWTGGTPETTATGRMRSVARPSTSSASTTTWRRTWRSCSAAPHCTTATAARPPRRRSTTAWGSA